MQSTAQSFSRITTLLRHATASFVENPLITTARTSATNSATCSCSYTVGYSATESTSRASSALPSLGRYISSFTPCCQNEISPEQKKGWSDLTQHQKKQLLKPATNRNHFKRMWKKDLQIRQAYQTYKRQQAAADATRLKNLRDKWKSSAALWRASAEQMTAKE